MLTTIWNYSDTLAPIAVLLLLVSCKNIGSRHLLTTYLAGTVLLMGYSNWLADKNLVNTHVYHVYTLVEAWLLVPLLHGLGKPNRRLLWGLLLGYTLFWILNVWLLEPLGEFNSNSGTVLGFLVSFLCFRYFLQLVKTDQILYFQRLPSFYIVSGLLFYSMVSILVISSYKQPSWFTPEDLEMNWIIPQVANIIKYIFWAIGILCCYGQARQVGSSS